MAFFSFYLFYYLYVYEICRRIHIVRVDSVYVYMLRTCSNVMPLRGVFFMFIPTNSTSLNHSELKDTKGIKYTKLKLNYLFSLENGNRSASGLVTHVASLIENQKH